MSRTQQQPQETQQAAGDKKRHHSPSPTISSPCPSLPPQPSASRSEEEEKQTKEAQGQTELSRFLQYRARLEFAELMTRRLRVAEEEIEEEEELEREVWGGRRNVGRFGGLGGWGDSGGRREGGGGVGQNAGEAVGSSRCGGGGGRGDGDGVGNRERSCDLVLPPPQLEPPPRSREFREGGVRGHVEAEMDGLRGRIRRLTGEIVGMRKAVEEERDREQEARSRLVSDEEDEDGSVLLDTYFPSSPILSSLYPAKERRKTVGRPGTLDPE